MAENVKQSDNNDTEKVADLVENKIISPDDPDLDDLLDSALDDFDKKPEEPKLDETKPEPEVSATATGKAKEKPRDPDEFSPQQEELFNELFNIAGIDPGHDGDAAFEDMMKTLMSGQSDMLQQLNTAMPDSLPDTGTEDGGSQGGIDETLQQTLNNMAQNLEGMNDAATPDSEILRMLSGMGLDSEEGAGGQGDLNFLPMMQNMMKSLMSKDVLYPSLKEISDKYPAWLEANEANLSKPDLDKYTKQYGYMKTIVTEYESEKSDDSDSVNKLRFEKIMDVMQRMQELGQPPKDLVGDMPAGLEMPNLGASAEQCSLM